MRPGWPMTVSSCQSHLLPSPSSELRASIPVPDEALLGFNFPSSADRISCSLRGPSSSFAKDSKKFMVSSESGPPHQWSKVIQPQIFRAFGPTRLRESNERISSLVLDLLEFGPRDRIDAWSVRPQT